MNVKKASTVVFFLILFIVSQFMSHSLQKSFGDEDPTNILYFELFNNAFNFTSDELSFLKQNDFIVLNRMGTDDILDAYKYYWESDLPIFITTDSMLQVWHLIFDNILEQTEEEVLFPLLGSLSTNLTDTFISQVDALKDDLAYIDALIYVYVAAKLVNPIIYVPYEISESVSMIIQAIMDEITIFDARGQFQTNLTKRFIDDFSQYKPRGHYTKSEALKTYFRLFKWFSRIPFYFDNYPAESILSRSPQQMIKSASILIWTMKNSIISWESHNVNGLAIWKGFKAFLDALVGQTYAVSPIDIDNIYSELKGPSWHPIDLTSDDIALVQSQILLNDSIPAPNDAFIVDALIPGTVRSPKAMVLFGERLTLDTYALNNLVYPYVPQRLLPNGLDFVTTVLESNRGLSLLPNKDYLNYPEMINQTKEELQNWSE
ncbi:MAG: DUF3160 domain-containing protein, partial [Candidatus Hodarchaeales archaeon]